jgi:hypothetical protein
MLTKKIEEKIKKIKAKVKNTDLASYFAHDENGIPLLTFSPEIEEIFQKGIERIIERNKEKENK